ncbi:MAG: amidohydrolase [Saprospiraceae bacterium]|jgi:amidohydrolase
MSFQLLPFLFAFLLVDYSPSPEPILNAEEIEYLTTFYKDLHQHPELSLEEEKTAASLALELRKIGYDVTEKIGGHGIVGIMKNGNGHQILYRTDMDALPMQEKTKLEYTSLTTSDAKMHSCGHDMHMTTWLGTARYMAANRDKWSGTLMLIGQPAEEIGAGARMMIDDNLYGRFGVPDYGLGLHCSPSIPAGQVGLSEGYTMANTESIDIKVFGIGAHGAAPHMSIDPVVVASMIVMDLQTIVSRNLKPTESAVVTVGAIKGGTKHNIIPDEVTLQLTVRSYTEEVRQMIHKRIKEISRGVAIAAGLSEDKMPEVIIPEVFTPANYNEPMLTAKIKKHASAAIGSDNVIYAEPQMVGEDFARYGSTEDKVPTVLYWLGTVPKERIASGNLPGLHSPFYYPEIEKTLTTGIKVNSEVLMGLME